MKQTDFSRLSEFLVRTIDEESLGALNIRLDQEGLKFCSPFFGEEPLFHTNVSSLNLTLDDEASKKFLSTHTQNATDKVRVQYGFPCYFDDKGFFAPLFFMAVDVKRTANEEYVLTPVPKSLGANRLILQQAGLSISETDALVRQLEGKFGAFEARLKTASDTLDLPNSILSSALIPPFNRDDAIGSGWRSHAVLFVGDVTQAKRGVRFELARFIDTDGFAAQQIEKTALSCFLDRKPARENSQAPRSIFISRLNAQQETAVAEAAIQPLTVVTGPPGTGKSQVVVNILANCVANNESVLFASNNNKAVNEVQERLGAVMGDAGDWSLRLGNRKVRVQTRDSMLSKLSRFQSNAPTQSASEIERDLISLKAERDILLAELASIHSLNLEIENAYELQRRATSSLPVEWVEACGDTPQEIDTAGFNDAYDEIAMFSGRMQGGLIFRLKKLLSGERIVRKAEAKLRKVYEQLPDSLQHKFFPPLARIEPDQLLTLSGYLANHISWIQAIGARRRAMNSLSDKRSSSEINADLKDVDDRYAECGQRYVREIWTDKLRRSSEDVKSSLKSYFDSLAKRGNNRAFFTAFEAQAEAVMKGLPVWIVTNLSASGSLPFKSGLFDCVIIDEASQSDFTSIIPLLYRAKRAVFVGDPKQLPHIPGITPEREQYIANDLDVSDLAVELSPVQRSAYDVAALLLAKQGGKETLLSQHYRCHPEIIEFSNQAFYGGNLIVQTGGNADTAFRHFHGVHWHPTPGRLARLKKSAANLAETEQIVALMSNMLHASPSPVQEVTTIGVVTPFKAQEDAVTTALTKQPWWSRIEHRLVVGTAHKFQGSECDFVFFSPVVCKALPENLRKFASTSDNLLNVALTRAKLGLHIVGDDEACRDVGGVLMELVEYADDIRTKRNDRQSMPSPAELAFREILDGLGLSYVEEYEVHRVEDGAPYRLDFVVTSENGNRYDLEVDGRYHWSDERLQEDAIRNSYLAAHGYTVIRFPAAEVLNSPAAVRERLLKLV